MEYRQITNIRYFESNYFFNIFADNYGAKVTFFPKTCFDFKKKFQKSVARKVADVIQKHSYKNIFFKKKRKLKTYRFYQRIIKRRNFENLQNIIFKIKFARTRFLQKNITCQRTISWTKFAKK